MASSALNVLSGIAAAAAGLAGQKVDKKGGIPGLDLATILPALLGGGKAGGAASIAGALAGVAAKSGLLNANNLGNLASLAGSLLSTGKKTEDTAKAAAGGGIAGLAAAIAGNSGSGTDLGSIASLASTLIKSAKNDKEKAGLASDLGHTLSETFGISLPGGATALKALDKVVGGEDQGSMFKSILKSLV